MYAFDFVKFGLTEKQFLLMINTIFSFTEIEKVLIFGSRATGIFKPASDIDLAVFGQKVKRTTINRLYSALDDLPLPFMFDLLNYNQLTNESLKEKIDEQGQIFFDVQLNTAL